MHVSTSPEFWDNVGEKFYRKYWRLDEWHHELADRVTKGLPIIGPTGRQWMIEMKRDRWGNLKLPWTVFTNYPVQGTGADVMMIFRISFWRRLKALGLHHVCKVVSTVHDSIYVDVPEEYVDTIVKLMFEVSDDLVENIRKVFKYDWKTPLTGEIHVGMDMLNMNEVKRKA